ncbi:uncharacterized protein LOC128235320 [Mya arenaria]|uniref:uncharacterized protein LOC128235320 n=1 Tax=Mya arenaria TaxID=6604 RepID=UPI0022E713F2|nr:uncharacterized protein LOC128235320 [Mya arenaria]
MGVKLLNPPPAKQVTLTEALKSPQKEKISVTGMIVQEEAVKTVNVRGEDVPIKVIILEDTSKAKAKVSLWRDASMSPTRPGDFVVVTNQYRGETSLSTTNRTKVEKIETPLTRRQVKVVGLSVDGPTADLLLEDDDILTVSRIIDKCCACWHRH